METPRTKKPNVPEVQRKFFHGSKRIPYFEVQTMPGGFSSRKK